MSREGKGTGLGGVCGLPSDFVQQLWEGISKVKLRPRTCLFEDTSAYVQRPEYFSAHCGHKRPSADWLQASRRAVCKGEGRLGRFPYGLQSWDFWERFAPGLWVDSSSTQWARRPPQMGVRSRKMSCRVSALVRAAQGSVWVGFQYRSGLVSTLSTFLLSAFRSLTSLWGNMTTDLL